MNKPQFVPHAEIDRLRDYADRLAKVKPPCDEPVVSLCDILDHERRRLRNWRALSFVAFLLGFWAGYLVR